MATRYYEMNDEELEQVELRAQRIATIRIQRLSKAARDAAAMGDNRMAATLAHRALRAIQTYRYHH
jgi:hypothetical protein